MFIEMNSEGRSVSAQETPNNREQEMPVLISTLAEYGSMKPSRLSQRFLGYF